MAGAWALKASRASHGSAPGAFLGTCGHFEPQPQPGAASGAGRKRGRAGARRAYAPFLRPFLGIWGGQAASRSRCTSW